MRLVQKQRLLTRKRGMSAHVPRLRESVKGFWHGNSRRLGAPYRTHRARPSRSRRARIARRYLLSSESSYRSLCPSFAAMFNRVKSHPRKAEERLAARTLRAAPSAVNEAGAAPTSPRCMSLCLRCPPPSQDFKELHYCRMAPLKWERCNGTFLPK